MTGSPVQSQADLAARVRSVDPARTTFVKDRPILGWRLDGRPVADLPSVIRNNLGAFDATDYDSAYVRRNAGSIIALQVTEDGPDFYIVGKSTYDASYRQVPLADVAAKTPGLVDRLAMLPDLLDLFHRQHPNLVGARKVAPVPMIRMSDIGYGVDRAVTIASAWGPQTKPAGQDAFLVQDGSRNRFHMVNAGSDGLPSGYVPAA